MGLSGLGFPGGNEMEDTALVAELEALGIDRYCPHMTALWPFVELAWTDQRVTDDRRARVVHLVRSRRALAYAGVRTLQDWLSFKPSDKFLSRGHAVVNELIRRHDPDAVDRPSDIISYCQAVAEEAARVLGNDPKPVPREALLEIAGLLFIRPDTAWTDLDAQVGQTVVMKSPFAGMEVDYDKLDLPDGLRPQKSLQISGLDTPAAVSWRDGHGALHTMPVKGSLTVGRGPDNDVVLATDIRVSRHHCRIEWRDEGWFVVDLDSANGTHVDGSFVIEAELVGGEVLRVGDTELTFQRHPES